MMHESVHLGTSIGRSADEVYAYVTDPTNLSNWAAGLAESPLRQVGGEWVAESPLGRVVVSFVAPNDLGVADHDVRLPSGETVTNPMRVIANGDGCDVVFSVRRRPEMSDADFAADADAVSRDLAVLRGVMEADASTDVLPLSYRSPRGPSNRESNVVSTSSTLSRVVDPPES